jgi:hypothetical protein
MLDKIMINDFMAEFVSFETAARFAGAHGERRSSALQTQRNLDFPS